MDNKSNHAEDVNVQRPKKKDIVPSTEENILQKYLASMPSQRNKNELYDNGKYKNNDNMQEKDEKNTENMFKTSYPFNNKPEEYYSGSFENSNYPTCLNSLETVNVGNIALSPTKGKPSVRFMQDEESSGTAEEKGDVESIEKLSSISKDKRTDSWDTLNMNAPDYKEQEEERLNFKQKNDEYFKVKEENNESNPLTLCNEPEVKKKFAYVTGNNLTQEDDSKSLENLTREENILKDESRAYNLEEANPSSEATDDMNREENFREQYPENYKNPTTDDNINLIKQNLKEVEPVQQVDDDGSRQLIEKSKENNEKNKEEEQIAEDYKNLIEDKRMVEDIIASQISDENSQQCDKSGREIQLEEKNQDIITRYEENNESIQGYDGDKESIQEYDGNVQHQPYENVEQPIGQYDHSAEEMLQYDENGQTMQQKEATIGETQDYEISDQQMPQLNEIQQYDDNGQPTNQYDNDGQNYTSSNMMYDENGQLMNYLQYDENGQPIYDPNIQYDENGQIISGYDPNIQYDENGQPILNYDPNLQYDENGQIIQGYDENGQPIPYDPNVQYGENLNYVNTNYEASSSVLQDYNQNSAIQDDTLANITEPRTSSNVQEIESISPKEDKPNVMEMLDTDTESTKQDTRVSNETDFDFSNK